MPVEQIEDPSVRLRPTLKLINFVKKHVNAKDLPDCFREIKKSNKNSSPVLLKVQDIKWLNNLLINHRSKNEEKIYLHELLEGVDLILPEPKITPRNPVLDARVRKLQAQQDARDYNAMTKDVDALRRKLPDDTLAYQMKEINRHLIAIGSFVVTVVASFFFGFTGIEYGIGPQDFGFKLLLGIICALIVALAEIYFLAKELNGDYLVVPPPPPVSSTNKKPHQE